MNINQMMKQAQELQKKLQKQQEELASKEFEASAVGGMVTVRANGKGQILSVKLEPEVVNSEDIDMLQDLIVAGVNETLSRIQEAQQGEMAGMMDGMNLKIPGLM